MDRKDDQARLARALAAYKRDLEARFGARLVSLRLFGSYARGDFSESSDADVAVVVDELTEDERSLAIDLAIKAWMRERGPLLSPLVWSRVEEREMTDARKAVTRGNDALLAAEILLASGLTRDAVSRAYYAALHYARAVLLTEGLEPETHGEVIDVLRGRFEPSGRVAAETTSTLARLQTMRDVADYGSAEIDARRGESEIAAAKAVVSALRAVLVEAGIIEPA